MKILSDLTPSLRDIWPNEAKDFTPWLAENIKALSNALGFELEVIDTEVRVGDFFLDILAEDVRTKRAVIIENQLTPSDHGHLGQLITYASGFEAFIIIWIAETIRDEHMDAIDWLNQRTDPDTQFFAVEVEGLQIDDSKPAPNFKPIVFPNEWQRSKNRTSKNRTSNADSKGEMYRSYFQPMADELREKHSFTTSRKARTTNDYSFYSGIKGVHYCAVFGRSGIPRVELYFTKETKIDTKALFDILETQKRDIEEQYGQDFVWSRLNDKQACAIRLIRNRGKPLSEMTEKEKDEVRRWHINNLLKMKKVFNPLVEQALQDK